jgi:thioredoxin reductase (NADPH)
MYDLIIIGAGPAGIALAVEARVWGFDPAGTLILEKSGGHNATIRHLYPEHKLTTANYKGFAPRCEGRLCIDDMSKGDTLAYFDRAIDEHGVRIQYGAEVHAIRRIDAPATRRFRVESSTGSYEAALLAVAIGIFGRPNKPSGYRLPVGLKDRIMFGISSARVVNEHVLVVGGGDTAAEYVECLHRAGNRVTLSYRGPRFARLNGRNHAMMLSLEGGGEIEILLESNIDRIDVDAGRPHVVFRETKRYPSRAFDRIVYALGGTTPTDFLRGLGIDFDDRGPIVREGGETNVPGLFLLGDLVVGRAGGSINTACNSAVHAMRRIAEHFRREPLDLGSDPLDPSLLDQLERDCRAV